MQRHHYAPAAESESALGEDGVRSGERSTDRERRDRGFRVRVLALRTRDRHCSPTSSRSPSHPLRISRWTAEHMPTNNFYGTSICDAVQFPGVYTPLSVARAAGDTAAAALRRVDRRAGAESIAADRAGILCGRLQSRLCSAKACAPPRSISGPSRHLRSCSRSRSTRFDTAVVAATRAADAPTLNIALLGRARTEFDAGDLTSAAADAAQIPDGFEYDCLDRSRSTLAGRIRSGARPSRTSYDGRHVVISICTRQRTIRE